MEAKKKKRGGARVSIRCLPRTRTYNRLISGLLGAPASLRVVLGDMDLDFEEAWTVLAGRRVGGFVGWDGEGRAMGGGGAD